jgi:hypothetical protein
VTLAGISEKKRKDLKERINELATNSMNKNIRNLYRINYHPGSNVVKDDMVICMQILTAF